MPRGLDHIVHAVSDLDAAGAMYQRLGFTVGARNRHPWGTHNRLVQLPGFFIEIVTVAEPDKLTEAGIGRLFGGFNRDFLARHEGLSLVILSSEDAGRDAAEFRAAGIAASETLRFGRQGQRPDGSAVEVAFSLAFAADPAVPDIGFAACQHHFPQNFWNPAFQAHANTAVGVVGAVIVAENPADHHVFLSAFVGERDLKATSSGIEVPTPRGDIAVMPPAAFKQQYGLEPPELGRGPRLAALRIAVADMATLLQGLQAADIDASMHMGRLVIGPRTAMGATLVFERATGR